MPRNILCSRYCPSGTASALILSNSSDTSSPDGWATAREEVSLLFDKIKAEAVQLGQYLEQRIFRGILTGLSEALEIDQDTSRRFMQECPGCKDLIRPFLGGQDIRRYHVRTAERYLIAIPCGWTTQAMANGRKIARSASEREAWKW